VVELLAAELAAGLLLGSELGGATCATAAPPINVVLSTIIDVARISYHPFVLCHDNRCGILAFHIP
jgi:hypothetical protein